ncbi:MAG TPA: pyridoxamine 5'-phosphate oxidase family protein [Solirubrobacteraceae bacterium]|nr:pyridoxamine 5'-phosphate oxidase family protein [Solirubrobacteraceae bacterium]
MSDLPASPRVKLRREPSRGRHDRATIDAVLDRALVAHVAFVADGQPYCIPTLCARIGDRALIHGSAASRMLRGLSAGAPACLTATCTDGIVLARSVFNHSINYASALVLGELVPVTDPAGKLAALEAFTEKLVPGRWAEVRPPSAQELKATAVLALEIDEASAKLRTGPPSDEDPEVQVWAGVVPILSVYGEPLPAPDQAPDLPLAPSVARLTGR